MKTMWGFVAGQSLDKESQSEKGLVEAAPRIRGKNAGARSFWAGCLSSLIHVCEVSFWSTPSLCEEGFAGAQKWGALQTISF